MLAPYPLNDTQHNLLGELTRDLEADALHWLSGYFAGVAQRQNPELTPAPSLQAAVHPEASRLTIVYGSQTGNAKRTAESLAREAETLGLSVRLLRADRYPTRELKTEKMLYVVISTQGEGDPPDDSVAFIEFLNSRRAPKLPDMQYAILGLGDSSYPDFCGIAYALDRRLAELGAKRLHDTAAADLDIETVSAPWQKTVLEQAQSLLKTQQPPPSNVTPLRAQTASDMAPVASWSRDRPFQAELLLNQRITASHSERDVRHLELSLEGSGLQYQPGDSLGVWPMQDALLVDEILTHLDLNADENVQFNTQSRSLREWLQHHRELTQLTRPFLQAHAERAKNSVLDALLHDDKRDRLKEFMATQQLADLLRLFPATWSATDLVASLRPLVPRLYSIASSQALVGEEVHLTLANVAYQQGDENRWGVASRHLSECGDGDTVSVFVEENDRFRLPPDTGHDIILIGPGTGIAPFRAFIQERSVTPGEGRAWLFFGNPHFDSDFLYQTEWLQALEDGHLHRMDVAFSRDQENKIYVQDKLLENADEVFQWLQTGAHLYVCGDATRMARDVHDALLKIARDTGGQTPEQARAWLDGLAAQGRYARDVY